MEITGTLIEKFETMIVSSSFTKREFIVEYAENPKYPEFIKFELHGVKCDLLNNFEVGDILDVYFNLKGRKWVNPKGETVYFNSLQAWKISNDSVSGDLNTIYENDAQAEARLNEQKEMGQGDVPF